MSRHQDPNIRNEILAALAAGDACIKDLAHRMHLTKYRIERHVLALHAEGRLVRHPQVVRHLESRSRQFVYSLAEDAPQIEASPTPPAYRNLRLTENLTDYGRANQQFAALCMMVRK